MALLREQAGAARAAALEAPAALAARAAPPQLARVVVAVLALQQALQGLRAEVA